MRYDVLKKLGKATFYSYLDDLLGFSSHNKVLQLFYNSAEPLLQN